MLSTTMFAQNQFGFTLNAGIVKPAKTTLEKGPTTGLTLSVGPRIGVVRERVYVKPTLTLKVFDSEVNDALLTNESILIFGVNAEILTRIGEFDQIQWYPLVKLGYNVMAFSKTKGLFGNTDDNINVMNGGALNYGLGLVIEYRSVQLRVIHEFFDPKLKISESYVRDGGSLADYNPSFKLNTFSIMLGYTLNRR